MEYRFKNRIAVISGGADGLGKGIARRLGSEGAKLILVDINAHLLKQTVDELNAEGLIVEGHQLNIADDAAVEGLFKKIDQIYGKIDIVVNSAGIVGLTNTPISSFPVEDFDRIYSVNLRGAFSMCKYAVRAMEKNSYGRILLIASIAGKEGNPMMVGYSATKAGVIGLVKSVGKEVATKGITVNGIAPAVIKTAMNEDTAPEQLAYMTDKIPMKRLGTIEEVAALACWIVSEEASFNTGHVFDLSGGRATY